MATDDITALRELAKEAGIKSWHVKSADTLQKELDALTGSVVVPDEATVVSVVSLDSDGVAVDVPVIGDGNIVAGDEIAITPVGIKITPTTDGLEVAESPQKEATTEEPTQPEIKPEQPATHEIPAPQARSNVRMQHPRTGEVLMVWDKDVTHYREKGWATL